LHPAHLRINIDRTSLHQNADRISKICMDIHSRYATNRNRASWLYSLRREVYHSCRKAVNGREKIIIQISISGPLPVRDLSLTRKTFVCMTPGPGAILGVHRMKFFLSSFTAASTNSVFRGGEHAIIVGILEGMWFATQSKSTSMADRMHHARSEVCETKCA
jgi:hypothetical protein